MDILRDKIPIQSRILVSVSGGADSIYLIWFLSQYMSPDQLYLIYFDHGLRAPSEIETDIQCIKKIQFQIQIKHFKTISLKVKAHAKQHAVSIEMSARQLRRLHLVKHARQYSCDYIAMGHHLDDHIETFFLQLTRGSKSHLKGISDHTHYQGISIIRPLLRMSKQEILTELNQLKIEYSIDRTNSDLQFSRNKLRHQMIPVLAEVNPNFRTQIASFISYFKQTQSFILDHLNSFLSEVQFDSHTIILPDRIFNLLGSFFLKQNWIRYSIQTYINKYAPNTLNDIPQFDDVHIQSICQLFSKSKRKQSSLPFPFNCVKKSDHVCIYVKTE
jgi:tRNA(Ile)-lysidine synthetase-like protein